MRNDPVKSRKSPIRTPDTDYDYQGDHHPEQGIRIDFHGASVINERGEEIPITDHMVQNACKTYMQQWEQWEVAQKKHRRD